MNCIQEAVRLNNSGVALMKHGDTRKAIRAIQQGLLKMKAAVAGEAVDGQLQFNGCLSRTTMFRPTLFQLEATHCQKDEVGFVFDRAFIIDEKCIARESFSSGADIEYIHFACSVVILFNFAQANFQDGRFGRESSLSRAVHIYQMVVELVESSMIPIGDESSSFLAVIAILSLNNSAQISMEFCDYEQSHSNLDSLSRLLMSVVGPGMGHVLSEEETKGIVLNAMLLQAPTTARIA